MGTNLGEASAMDAETSDPLHKPELVRCAAGAEAEGRPGAPRHPVATAGQLVHLQRRSRRQAPRALAPPRLCHRGWCNGRHQAYKCGTRPCCGQRSVAIAHTPAFFFCFGGTRRSKGVRPVPAALAPASEDLERLHRRPVRGVRFQRVGLLRRALHLLTLHGPHLGRPLRE